MKNNIQIIKLSIVLAGAFLVPGYVSAHCGGCAGDAKAHKHDHGSDIVETAVKAGSFNTLAAALKAANLVDTLQGEGPFTVFAPTDEAFAKLPAGTVESLLKPENRDQLIAVLTYHVVPGKVKAEQVVNLDSAKTVEGSNVSIMVKNGVVYVDNAQVVQADVDASNGVIHVIDTVILPNS